MSLIIYIKKHLVPAVLKKILSSLAERYTNLNYLKYGPREYYTIII